MSPPPRLCALAAAVLVGCAPALDWREVRPEGGELVALFPCRPDRHEREVPLAGQRLRMGLLVCEAGGASFALAWVDTAEPGATAAVLADWRRLAAEHIGATAPQVRALALAGTTANPQAAELTLRGRLPDGGEVRQHAVYFAHGLRAYQASALGRRLDEVAVQDFLTGLKLPT